MTRLLLVVAAALVDGAGRVLVTQRPEGKALAGLWEFPGGKVEAVKGTTSGAGSSATFCCRIFATRTGTVHRDSRFISKCRVNQ